MDGKALLAMLVSFFELVAKQPALQDAAATFLAKVVQETPLDSADDEVGTILIKAGKLLGGTG